MGVSVVEAPLARSHLPHSANNAVVYHSVSSKLCPIFIVCIHCMNMDKTSWTYSFELLMHES